MPKAINYKSRIRRALDRRTDFEVEIVHVLGRLKLRYPKMTNLEDIVLRVVRSLAKCTPYDWRFTDSVSSRFFVIDQESGAKFMGMTIRDSQNIQNILSFIQRNVRNSSLILSELDNKIQFYIDEIENPNLSISHHIRTVYPKGDKSEIAEERELFEKTRDIVSHVIPLASRKLGSRPNAIVAPDGALWVRQHMNWIDLKNTSAPEYYLFQPITRNYGITKNTFRIFSYDANGNLKTHQEKTINCESHHPGIKDFKPGFAPTDIRSESYWKVPTYLDRRLIDLDYKERYSKELIDKGEDGITSDELIELYYLKKIVEKAKEKLHRK